MALLEIGIVGLLGATVAGTLRRPSRPIPVPSPCDRILLDNLPSTWTPAVGRTADTLILAVSPPSSDTPAPDFASRTLWALLDTLSTTVTEGCALPPTIILRLTLRTGTTSHLHIVRLPGEAIAQWSHGEISEAALREQAAYRHLMRPEPLPTSAGPSP